MDYIIGVYFNFNHEHFLINSNFLNYFKFNNKETILNLLWNVESKCKKRLSGTMNKTFCNFITAT